MTEKDYYIKKKYCPSKKENVVMKVYPGEDNREECLNLSECSRNGGCSNGYLNS